MPGTHIALSSRTVSQRGEISGTAPELRLTETDQTDPAGRYRLGVTADSFVIARSQAAGYANALGSATDFVFLVYDRANTVLGLDAYESNAWAIRVQAGAAATVGTNARVTVQGHATTPYVDILTGNAGGASLVSRLLVGGGAGTPDIDVNTAQLDMNGQILKGLATVRGQGTTDVFIYGNKAATDATARNIQFLLLDVTTDADTLLVQMTANALAPSVDVQDNLLFRIGTSGDTAFVNSTAGVAANTALTGVLVGTPVTPVAPAANSLIVGNITASGDVLIAVNKGGTSHMAFMADASTGDTLLGVPTGQSVDIYIAGVKEVDYATGALAFQQQTTISTTANDLILSPAVNVQFVTRSFWVTDAGRGASVFTTNTQVVSTTKTIATGLTNSFGHFFIVSGFRTDLTNSRFIDFVPVIRATVGTVFGATGDTTPDARTYTLSGDNLQLAMAANTYDVQCTEIRNDSPS